jgi:hypothetical protein
MAAVGFLYRIDRQKANRIHTHPVQLGSTEPAGLGINLLFWHTVLLSIKACSTADFEDVHKNMKRFPCEASVPTQP